MISLPFDIEQIISENDKNNLLPLYFELLKEENTKINLVSRETIAGGLPLLAAESLLPFHRIIQSDFESYLDIGSGGGFPSLPVLLTRKISRVTLVDRTAKKTIALGRIVDGLPLKNLELTIIPLNFEEHRLSGAYDLITMRLVKLTKPLLKKILPLMGSSAIFIYYQAGPKASNKHFCIIQK